MQSRSGTAAAVRAALRYARATWEALLDFVGAVWLFLALVLVPLIAVQAAPGDLETRVRLAGLVLELLGLGGAAIGLWRLSEFFHASSPVARPVEAFYELLRAIKHGGKSAPAELSAATSSTQMMSDQLTVVVEGGDLGDRVARLEQSLQSLQERVSSTETDVGRLKTNTQRDLAQLRKELDAVEKQLEDQLEELSVGSLHQEWAALLCLATGAVLTATPPQEVEHWLWLASGGFFVGYVAFTAFPVGAAAGE